MKSKTILGADGATKMRQITVGIHGNRWAQSIKPALATLCENVAAAERAARQA